MFTINSTIYDFNTREALPYATAVITDSKGTPIEYNGLIKGAKANTDGVITLQVPDEDAYIKVSYVGYESLVHPADDYRNDDIYLSPKKQTASTKPIIIKAKRYPKKTTEVKTKPTKKSIPTWLIVIMATLVVVVVGVLIFKTSNSK